MKKQLIIYLLILTMLVSACSKGEGSSDNGNSESGQSTSAEQGEENTDDNAEEPEEEAIELVLWSYSDEMLTEIDEFETEFPATVEFIMQDADGFVPMVAGMLKGEAEEVPDIIAVSEEDLMNPMIRPYLVNLEDYLSDELSNYYQNTVPYVINGGKAYSESATVSVDEEIVEGESGLYGVSYMSAPVGNFYRRSYAMAALGTDRPEDVLSYFESYEGILDLAGKLKNNGIKLVSDIYALEDFWSVESDRFIDESGLFVMDDSRAEFLELIKVFKMNNYMSNLGKWSDSWLTSMYSTTASDEFSRVFSYLLPNWALTNVVMLVGDDETLVDSSEDGFVQVYNDTLGDWAVLPKNYNKYQGSYYLAITTACETPEMAIEYIKFMTCDEEHLQEWLGDSYVLSSNVKVQEQQVFELGNEFLGGQDYHQLFAEIAGEIDTVFDGNLGAQNLLIATLYQQVVHSFIKGDYHTVAEAINDFEQQVSEAFPELLPQEAEESSEEAESNDE